MPNGFRAATPELQTEFELELEKTLLRVRTEYVALPAEERARQKTVETPLGYLPHLEEVARKKLISRYTRISAAEELRLTIEAGEFEGLPPSVATNYLTWRQQEVSLLREQARLETTARVTQEMMVNMGAPSIWTSAFDWLQEKLPVIEGLVPDYRTSTEYKEALAEYNATMERFKLVADEMVQAQTYQSLYEGLGAYIQSGKVASYEDLFSLVDSEGKEITRFSEMGRDDPVLKKIFEQVSNAVLGLPAGESLKEQDYDQMIAKMAKVPEAVPISINSMTQQSIINSLTTRAVHVPTGKFPTTAAVLQGYAEAGVPQETIDELESLESYVNDLEDYWQALSTNREAVIQGLEDAKLPELGFWEYVGQTLSQPALTALDVFTKYYSEWVAPWGGMLYRAKYTYTRLPGAGLTWREKEFQKVYEEAKLTDDWWHAGGYAFENVELGFLDRVVFEWILEPTTWLGLGIMTKAATKVPLIGAKFLGPSVGLVERGWLKAWDVLIFDRVKAAGRFIQKTPFQASQLFAGSDMAAVGKYLSSATHGTYYSKIPLSKAIPLLKQARSWAIHHPEDNGLMGKAGQALLRRDVLTETHIAELARKFGSEIPISKEMILNINSITNGQIIGASGLILTKRTTPAFLLRTLGVHETKKSLSMARKEVNKLFQQGMRDSNMLMDKARNVPDLLTQIFNKNHNTYLNVVESAAAHNLEMSGRISSLLSTVDWKVMTAWRNTFDRWVVTPGARMYLAFSAYGPGNIIEGFIKQAVAGQIPFNPLKLLSKNKPISVINPTARGQRLMTGLSKPIELESAIPRIEMAGETPTFLGLSDMSPKYREALGKWRSILSGGPIGRFFIDLPGRFGVHQRWDYYRKVFMTFLSEEEATAITSVLARNIDDAVRTLPDNVLSSLNISKHQLKSELLERAIQGPAATRNMLDDIIADRLMLAQDVAKREARKLGKKIGEKRVSADTALADRMSGGRVGEVAGQYPLVPQPFTDDLIQSASDGSLWMKGGRIIDDKVESYTAGMYDYFVHSPDFYKGRFTRRVDDVMALEPRNREEFTGMVQELQELQKFYGESVDDVIRAMNELEQQMRTRMKVHDWNEWRAQYTTEVYEGLAKYGDTAQGGFEDVIGKLQKDIGIHLTDNEAVSVSKLFSAWTDEQRFLKDFWRKRHTTEMEQITNIRLLKGAEKQQAWTEFFNDQTTAHNWRREKQAPFRDAAIKQEFYTSEALGTLGFYPPAVDASGRRLTKMDVATLFHSHPSQMGQSMLRLETMTLKPRHQFISEVRSQADIMASKAGSTRLKMGFTDEGIGTIYDDILRDMYMSPQAASVLEPHLMELRSLQSELHSIYATKGVAKGTADDFQKWLDDLGDVLEEVPGYATPKVKLPKFEPVLREDIGLAEKLIKEDGETIRVADITYKDKIRDQLIDAAEKVPAPRESLVEGVGVLKDRTLKDEIDLWFSESSDVALQNIGKSASQSPEYLAKVRGILKEKYPSGYIRIYRGSGASKATGAKPLEREFTNVTSSRSVAQSFEDTWTMMAPEELARAKISLKEIKAHPEQYVGREQDMIDQIKHLESEIVRMEKQYHTPEMDNILIKVDDVISIGSVDESELIIRASIIKRYLEKPLVTPVEPTKLLRGLSPEFSASKQRAADKASKEYYKDWADYTNENASTALMRTVYPFWTYELHRLFWLPRASIRTPGLFKGWGTYMDNTDMGYLHIPGTSLEVNPLRGTIFMGGMVRLIRKDYPEYYDRFEGVSEYFDFYSRYGFYPATYLNFLKMFGGKTVQGKANFGEILPAWIKTPLNMYIAAFPDSELAKLMLDTILPEPFRDYTTVLVANAICQREQKTFNGMDIVDKRAENLPLTKEEEDVWTRAVQQHGWMGAIQEQAGVIRIRTEEQIAAWDASSKLIEELTGYTLEDQLMIRRRGERVGDYAILDPLGQSLLGEMDAMKYHSGIFSNLMPTAWQAEDRRRREFFDEVRAYSDNTKFEQELVDAQARADTINMSQWAKMSSDLSGGNANFFDDLSETERYRDIAITMEDIIRDDGTIREGMITRAKDRNMLPPIEHPAKEILNLYYSIELEKKLDIDTGKLIDDWDGYFLRIDTIVRALDGAEETEFVQMITGTMTDLVRLKWEISRKYFRGYNRRQEAILLTQYGDDEQALIKKWIFGSPAERDAMQEVLDLEGNKLIAGYQKKCSVTGQNLRLLSPELDAWLQFFEITDTVLTPAAAELYTQYRKEYGLPQ